MGKKPMFRSEKLNKKKKKVVKEMDKDKLAFLLYLGQLDEVPEEGKKQQWSLIKNIESL